MSKFKIINSWNLCRENSDVCACLCKLFSILSLHWDRCGLYISLSQLKLPRCFRSCLVLGILNLRAGWETQRQLTKTSIVVGLDSMCQFLIGSLLGNSKFTFIVNVFVKDTGDIEVLEWTDVTYCWCLQDLSHVD